MSIAFAPIVRARPCPSLADLFFVGVAPIDYSPMLLLRLFGSRIPPDTLSSTGSRRWPARHYPCLWIQRPSSERWRDFNPPDSCATQHTLRRGLTSRVRASSATTPRLPDADQGSTAAGQTRDLPGSDAILSCVMWPSTPVGRQHLA